MYAKILVPLDGSKTAENVVPLARSFARGLQIPVELLGVVDVAEMARHGPPSQASMIRSIVDDATGRFDDYLERVAKNFLVGKVQCTVRKGNAADAIIEVAGGGETNFDCHGDPRSFRSRPLVARQRGGKGFARRVQSNAGGASEEGEEPRLGNGHIEASHRSTRWIRVVGTHLAPR